MNNRKKVAVPTAVSNRSIHDLSCNHTTTADFMQFNPIKVIPVVPKHGLKMASKSVVRLDAMPKPTMGHANLHSKWFFVPYRTIFPAWHEFYNDTNFTDGRGSSYIPETTPLISNTKLVNLLTFPTNAEVIATFTSIENYRSAMNSENAEARPSAHDFSVLAPADGSNDGTVTAYKFTPRGRQIYKILRSLGYQVSFVSAGYNSPYNYYHCALSLLAYFKIYMDWYYPSAYYDDYFALRINRLFSTDVDLDSILSSTELNEIFGIISTVCYDDDYFTNAWDNPAGPNTNFTDINFNDVTSENPDYQIGGMNSLGTPEINSNSSITQYGLRVLRSLTDYSRRHQIAGARVLDRALAQWGIKLDPALLRRSYYLGGHNDYIKFSDVYSTSDTTGAELGSYAGRGYGENNSFIDFDPQKEHGVIICISTIIPAPAYYQGQDPMTMCTTRLSYYQPELDDLAVQAVGLRELFVPMKQGLYEPVDWNDVVWGFTSQYSQYKRSYDQLTGDFVLDSLNVGDDSWHLFRDVSSYFPNKDSLSRTKHDIEFMQGTDATQYNRIFYNTANTADHFKIVHMFNIESDFPGKSMYEEYDFENEGKAPEVNIDLNGVKAN